FQAEDGIRDRNVTGVQTCALPIFAQAHQREMADRYAEIFRSFELVRDWGPSATRLGPALRLYRIPDPADCRAAALPVAGAFVPRSEERRGGRERGPRRGGRERGRK